MVQLNLPVINFGLWVSRCSAVEICHVSSALGSIISPAFILCIYGAFDSLQTQRNCTHTHTYTHTHQIQKAHPSNTCYFLSKTVVFALAKRYHWCPENTHKPKDFGPALYFCDVSTSHCTGIICMSSRKSARLLT